MRRSQCEQFSMSLVGAVVAIAAALFLGGCANQSQKSTVGEDSFTVDQGENRVLESKQRVDPQQFSGLLYGSFKKVAKDGTYTQATVIVGQESELSESSVDLSTGKVTLRRSGVSAFDAIRTRADLHAYLSSQMDTTVAEVITAAGKSVASIIDPIIGAYSGGKLSEGLGSLLTARAQGRAQIEAVNICTANPQAAPVCAALLGRQ